jgi:hypothetical protein
MPNIAAQFGESATCILHKTRLESRYLMAEDAPTSAKQAAHARTYTKPWHVYLLSATLLLLNS